MAMAMSIIEGRCTICDRAHDAERSAAFKAATTNLTTAQVEVHQETLEADGKLCVAPGSMLCLSRAIDWRERYKATVKQMTELANDTLVSVARMVKDHQAALDAARDEGYTAGVSVSRPTKGSKARTWRDGINDAIKLVSSRRDALSKMASPMLAPNPAAVQMAENIIRELKTTLSRGRLPEPGQ